jgi:hypothetical protein
MSLILKMQRVRGEVVLVLTVVLNHGQEVIEVREHDSPHTLAQEFCKAKGLDDSVIPSMSSFIEQQLKDSEEPAGTGLHIKLKPVAYTSPEQVSSNQPLKAHNSPNRSRTPPKSGKTQSLSSFGLEKSDRSSTPPPSHLTSSLSSTRYNRLYEEAKMRKVKAQRLADD